MSDTLTGWWNPQPLNPRSKFHYVGCGGKSLCGRWLYLAGDREEGNDTHRDNCPSCQKKKLKPNHD